MPLPCHDEIIDALRRSMGVNHSDNVAFLHVFNPSHEMALAADVENYTPSAQVKRMEDQMWYFPFIYAHDEDLVINAKNQAVDKNGTIVDLARTDTVYMPFPWGWNKAVRHRLKIMGVADAFLPDNQYLQNVRQMANRYFAAEYMNQLQNNFSQSKMSPWLVGQSMKFYDNPVALKFNGQSMMVKHLWSSSGRGNFILENDSPAVAQRIRAIIAKQGGVVADLFYQKHLDFAMEFFAFPDGMVRFLGYSLFKSELNGKYGGNLVESQSVIEQEIIKVFGKKDLLDAIKDYHVHALSNCCKTRQYVGFLGIDMMVVEHEGRTCIHPCVEINVRMNMGIVAMAAYLRPFFLDPDETKGDVVRSFTWLPSTEMRERGFHTSFKSRLISIRLS